MNKDMMNTKEVAQYLGINDKKIYQLVNEKKIPGTRVTGKWTFPKKLIDEWMIQKAQENVRSEEKSTKLKNHMVYIGSHDIILDILTHLLRKNFPELSLSLASVGSIDGLRALQMGNAHIAGCHLLSPETGEYNTPYIKRYLPDQKIMITNLVYRDQGLIVKPGNPLKILGFEDFCRPEVRMINRQSGSGTRILFDCKMWEYGIDPTTIRGYETEVNTHTEVAIGVRGEAVDVGLGIFSVSKILGLEFIPVTQERYDLVIPREIFYTKPIQSLLTIIRSQEFRERVGQMGGYDTRDSGTLVC